MKYSSLHALINLYQFPFTASTTEAESSMEGHILKRNNTYILKFMCSSSMNIFDNTAEFLIDHITTDVIKYHNGTCFDKEGVCLPNTCTCFKSENSFSWIHTSLDIPKWQKFSCNINTRDDENGNQNSVYTTLIYNGTGKKYLNRQIIASY